MSDQNRKDQQTTADQAARSPREASEPPVRDLETPADDAGRIRGGSLRRGGDEPEEEDVPQV